MMSKEEIAAGVSVWLHLESTVYQRESYIMMTLEALIENPVLALAIINLIDDNTFVEAFDGKEVFPK